MTNYHNFPPLSSLASYAIQGNFESIIMPPEQILQNALLTVIFNCCDRGSFESSDFSVLTEAWKHIRSSVVHVPAPLGGADENEEESSVDDEPGPHAADGQLEGGSGGPSPAVSGKKRGAAMDRHPRKQRRYEYAPQTKRKGPAVKKRRERVENSGSIREITVSLEYTRGFRVPDIDELDLETTPSLRIHRSLSPSPTTTKVKLFFNPFNL